MRELFEAILSQNESMELIIPDVKRKSVVMIQILSGVNITIYKEAVAPGSEVTFLSPTSNFTLSHTNLIKEIFKFWNWFVRL